MNSHRPWLIAIAALVPLWVAVAVVRHLTEDDISSPEETIGILGGAPWLSGGTVSVTERATYLENAIKNMNLLTFEQRREVRENGTDVVKKFFDSLTRDERKLYVDRTVQKAFDAVIKGFNAMAPEERKNVVTRVRRDIRANRNGDEAQKKADEDQKLFDEFIDIGIEDYLKNASTDEKMKLAPAIEDMQTRIRSGGR
jgi:hypothetical protein